MKLSWRALLIAGSLVLALSPSCLAVVQQQPSQAPNLDALEKQVVLFGASKADLDQLEQKIKQDPNNGQAHYVLGLALQKSGYTELAEEQYQLVQQNDPQFCQSLIRRFTAHINNGEYTAAIVDGRFMRTVAPDTPALLFLSGIMSRDRQNYADAMRRFNEIVRQGGEGEVIGLPSAIASCYVAQGQFSKAVPLVNKVLAGHPDHFEANAVKGEALMGMGRFRDSLEPLKKAYELRPLYAGSGYIYAHALSSSGHLAEAAEPAIVDLACEPKLGETKKLLMQILPALNGNEATAAIDSAAQKLKGNTNLARMYFALGDVYDKMSDFSNAYRVRKVGLDVNPNYTRGWYRQAQTLERLGDFYHAALCYRNASAQDPSKPQYQQAFLRASERSQNYRNDLAAQLRDFLINHFCHPSEANFLKVQKPG